ncbi:hypothetical protein MPSEU_000147800 [Mayamaea pseudoterrestris]|nr:hypothetical protein MPSEU_000147800 [Mayamaea pseudoterrestris]
MMQRWSLKSLAELQVAASHESARILIGDVKQRLARQITFCQDSIAPRVKDNSKLSKDLDHLLYIHHDTHRLCSELYHQNKLFARWNASNQHLYSSTLAQVRNRHATTVERWVDMVNIDRGSLHNHVLDILRGRVGIQLLCDHAVQAIDKSKQHGAVTLHCSVRDCIDDAHAEAKFLCEAHWQVSPELTVQGDDDVRITCVRPWLTHALVELIKNAMNASVCELDFTNPLSLSPPPIRLEISDDTNDVRIDIYDQGKGLNVYSDEEIETSLFALGVSSAGKKWDRIDEQQSYAMVRSPLSSLGVGLPLSRMMMKHFGGNVTLQRAQNETLASIVLPKDATILEPEVYK